MNGSIALPADFSDAVKHAAKMVDKAEYVRVISHYDADGLAAASVMAGALRRMGKQFHLSMVKGLDSGAVERIAKEGNANIIFLDMGSGQIDGLESLDAKVVALDHHKPIRKSKKVIQVNPHFHGMDGMVEACGASLSLLLSVVMDEANWDLSPIALAGVVGDRQHMGGMKGLNQQILELAVERKHVTVQRGLNLTGTTVLDTISNSVDPYFVGLSGREEKRDRVPRVRQDQPEVAHGLPGRGLPAEAHIDALAQAHGPGVQAGDGRGARVGCALDTLHGAERVRPRGPA